LTRVPLGQGRAVDTATLRPSTSLEPSTRRAARADLGQRPHSRPRQRVGV